MKYDSRVSKCINQVVGFCSFLNNCMGSFSAQQGSGCDSVPHSEVAKFISLVKVSVMFICLFRGGKNSFKRPLSTPGVNKSDLQLSLGNLHQAENQQLSWTKWIQVQCSRRIGTSFHQFFMPLFSRHPKQGSSSKLFVFCNDQFLQIMQYVRVLSTLEAN